MAIMGTVSAADPVKKIYLIDSYDVGYPWSDSIIEGAKKAIGTAGELKIGHMDSKRNPSTEAKTAAAERIHQEIEAWKPDAIVPCDDNASKYIIVPFYKDKTIPVVFCGINWDASAYGFPCSNVTGMLEVSLSDKLLDNMRKFSKGNRVAFLGVDNETDHVEADNVRNKFKIDLAEAFVKTFDEFKNSFLALQDKADMMIFSNYGGMAGWNAEEAKKFVRENTKIPTGSTHDFVAPYVLVDYAKLGTEQGEYAVSTALAIANGKPVKDFPIIGNRKGELYINLAIAKKLGVTVPLDVLEMAKVIKD